MTTWQDIYNAMVKTIDEEQEITKEEYKKVMEKTLVKYHWGYANKQG